MDQETENMRETLLGFRETLSGPTDGVCMSGSDAFRSIKIRRRSLQRTGPNVEEIRKLYPTATAEDEEDDSSEMSYYKADARIGSAKLLARLIATTDRGE